MSVIKLNPLTDKRWFDFIDKHPQATIFHHPAWLKVLYSQYKYPVFAFCIINGSGSINAGIPFCEVKSLTNNKRWISLPFTDHCEILFQDIKEAHEILKYLVNNYGLYDVSDIEIRSGIPGKHEFVSSSDVLIHKIELNENPEKVYAKFKDSHIRGIKKAMRNNLTVKKLVSQYALNEFYKLHLITRKKLGIPIQPKSYFVYLHEQLLKKYLGYILLAKKGSKVIAAALFLDSGNSIIFKYGASDTRYLKFRPNNLIFWEAIKDACLKGYKYFDLGKTDCDHTGLRRFKMGWGAEEEPLYFSFYPRIPDSKYFNYTMDKIVTPIIKHSPKTVCRITGEMFYKYFP